MEADDLNPTTPPNSSFAPLTPSQLAPHFPQLEVIKLLGHGGMGAVYKARQINLDRWVALKIIHPETARDPSFAERFTREARTLARLSHPGIVGVHDFGEIAGGIEPDRGPTYFFLMEYVDGVNLRDLITEQSLSAEQTLSIVAQICVALQYAHDCGVVHRDIKPENILVDCRGTVKIADFGLARLVESSRQEYTLTGSHQVMGTPRYMSPEQMAGSRNVDHRADIYSLGVVFYELLTGEVPMGQFEPPSRRAETDVRLDEVVMRALAREPARRFQSVSEMKLRVDAVSSGTDQAHDMIAGSPEPPRGMSSIVEREVAAAWRWVAGEPDPWTRQQELPALLMFMIAVVGSLMILLPWIEYRIDEPAESRQARAAVAAMDNGGDDAIPEYPIVESVRGTEYPGAGFASVAFAAIGLLILATPREMRRSVPWGLLLTLLAGIALIGVVAIHIDVSSRRFTIPIFKQGQWIDQTGTIAETSHQIGFFGALGMAIAELVLGATGVRHAIALRPRASADTDALVVQPRFSRKAIVGAVLAAIFFVGLLLLVAPATVVHQTVPGADGANPNTGGPAMFTVWSLLLLSLPVPLAAVGTTILGFVAVGEIRHSNGRLVGLGLAFLDAVLFPTLLIGSMVIAAACILSSPNDRVFAGICSAGLVVVISIIAWTLLWRSISRPPKSTQ